jgi:nucleoside triphosphate pyrophosphatase
LILASASPRRRAILEQLGVEFSVEPPEVDELDSGDPRAVVVENALRKARAVSGEQVLGADTEVVLDGEVLGKPPGPTEAEALLRRLSGREHEVMTAIAVRDDDGERTAVAVTKVRFRELADADIDWYVETGEWQGLAGGYAIQGRGAALVESIEGDYFNVVGLPVAALLALVPGLFRR